jgi:hypothetical protein
MSPVIICRGFNHPGFPPMDKTSLQTPPITNAADYIDALTRPRTQDNVVRKKVITGRRMRDKFRGKGEVVVVEVVKKLG